MTNTGTPIIDDDGTHGCAPFCPHCGHRLEATGIEKFAGGYINEEGWWPDTLPDGSANKAWEEDVVDLTAECTYAACPHRYEGILINFCGGKTNICIKTNQEPEPEQETDDVTHTPDTAPPR